MKINPNPKILGKTDELNQYRIHIYQHTKEHAMLWIYTTMDILRSTQTADVTENNA